MKTVNETEFCSNMPHLLLIFAACLQWKNVMSLRKYICKSKRVRRNICFRTKPFTLCKRNK